MPNIGTTELILIVAVLLLLFGGSKLPQLARAIGQSKRAFKEGIDEDEKDTAKKLSASSNASSLSDEELFAEAHRRAQQAKKSA